MACGFGTLVVSMLILFAALALTIVAAITNYWYVVESRDITSEEVRRASNYHFGFWMKCYDEEPPKSIPVEDLTSTGKDCVTIFEDLMQRPGVNQTAEEKLVIDLSRSYIALAIVSGVAQLATLVSLLCGSWPGDCQNVRRQGLYVSAAFILLVAIMAGIASGICFIAAREVETEEMNFYSRLDTRFGWSFMLHWGA
ncbi:uncharacterized protein LOC106013996, partial [Aplysia californica]